MLQKELSDSVERNDTGLIVIKIHMACTGNNHQLLVVPFNFLKASSLK